MNTTVQLTSLLLGLLVAAIAIMLIVRKYSETQYRLLQLDALRRVVSQYRLSKMLAYIGIKLDDYVTRIPTEEIAVMLNTASPARTFTSATAVCVMVSM